MLSNNEKDNKIIADFLLSLGFEKGEGSIPSEYYFRMTYNVKNNEIKGITIIEVFMDLGSIDVFYHDEKCQLHSFYGYQKCIDYINNIFKFKLRKDKIKKLFDYDK